MFLLFAVPIVCSAVRSRDSFEPGLPPFVNLEAFYPLVLTVYHSVRSAYIITHGWLRLGLRTRGLLPPDLGSIVYALNLSLIPERLGC